MTAEITAVVDLRSLLAADAPARDRPALLVLQGATLRRYYNLQDDTVTDLGRSPEATIAIDDTSVSRIHARIECRDHAWWIVDTGSSNGTFVNAERIDQRRLQHGDRILLGQRTLLQWTMQDAAEDDFIRGLYDSATRDPLTGIYNKRYFTDALFVDFSFSQRHRAPLSLLLLDIDFFKKINDTYGHLAGDAVLRHVAHLIQRALRAEDVFARYGGEEFAVILRQTDAERAFLIAERLRRAVAHTSCVYEGSEIGASISVGICTLQDKNCDTPKTLIDKADALLYRAKRNGRNRVESDDLDIPS